MKSASKFYLALFISSILFIPELSAQQVPDTTFLARVGKPEYKLGMGPTILIDESHHNFHTSKGRYRSFAKLLREDGYKVVGLEKKIEKADLAKAKILVISNALAAQNVDDWFLPTPSAFDPAEIALVKAWVNEGGSLWLIADHMPFPGAAQDLAAEFGILMSNGFAMDPNNDQSELFFCRSNNLLGRHSITDGRNDSERIDSVVSFTGQGFRLAGKGSPLMTLGENIKLLMPVVAWEFSKLTPSLSAAGMLQGAALPFGKGRIAVFGEAAMFSAQLAGPKKIPMGMNDPIAKRNPQFLLNIAHWLSGTL